VKSIAIDSEVSLREAERAPPRCGCLGQGHPRPKVNVSAAHLSSQGGVGLGAEQEMISAKGTVRAAPEPAAPHRRISVRRSAEQPRAAAWTSTLVLGRHPGELDLLRIVTMEAAAKAVAAKRSWRLSNRSGAGVGKILASCVA